MSDKTTTPRPLALGEPAYAVRVERMDFRGRKEVIEFEGYGLLRELLDDIEAEAEKRNWFEETQA